MKPKNEQLLKKKKSTKRKDNKIFSQQRYRLFCTHVKKKSLMENQKKSEKEFGKKIFSYIFHLDDPQQKDNRSK